LGEAGERSGRSTVPFPRHIAYAIAGFLAVAGIAAVPTALWYQDDACTGMCHLGGWGLGIFFMAATLAVLLMTLGLLCTLADVVGISHLSESSKLGHRKSLDTAAAVVIVALLGAFTVLVIVDETVGL
jgi:hypothetical protein